MSPSDRVSPAGHGVGRSCEVNFRSDGAEEGCERNGGIEAGITVQSVARLKAKFESKEKANLKNFMANWTVRTVVAKEGGGKSQRTSSLFSGTRPLYRGNDQCHQGCLDHRHRSSFIPTPRFATQYSRIHLVSKGGPPRSLERGKADLPGPKTTPVGLST